MYLRSLALQNFRSYKKRTFSFSPTTIVVGNNAIGKTNILEAIHFLSHAKSFRAEKDVDTILFGEDFCNIKGTIQNEDDIVRLEIIIAKRQYTFSKRFLINSVSKRQRDFVSFVSTVLFTPQDIELLTDSPGLRRRHIDRILVQTNRKYMLSLTIYEKGLKARNRLLHDIREGKRRYVQEEFEYWNTLLIEHARIIHDARGEYIQYLNASSKDIFPFKSVYDHSTFTKERLKKYEDIEQKTGITLIGPQRDEFLYYYNTSDHLIRDFCSRGEQRLAILQLKLLEIEYLREKTKQNPILLLDDIFSELDQDNIERITKLTPLQQTIITTTHMELVPSSIKKEAQTIEL